MKRRFRPPLLFSAIVLLASGLILSAGLWAKTSSQAAKILAKRLEDHYHDIRTLRAVFLERYSDGPQSARIESGTVYFRRPGRMRWQYESPEKKLFIADGKTIWFYVPADHTVTREPVKESSDWRTPLALLTGKANLFHWCSRIDLVGPAAGSPGYQVLRCLPKGEKAPKDSSEAVTPYNSAELSGAADFTEIFLEVNSSTGQLARVEAHEPGGIQIEYRFGGWKENIPLPESLFHYEPTAGVAIVNGAALSGETH